MRGVLETNNQSKFLRLGNTTEISCEVSADYVLPDYLGDVRRILFSECSVRPSGHFTDDSGDEFSGIVLFEVVYLDAEGKPTRAGFTADYDMKLRADEGRCSAICVPTVQNCFVRSTGPRRFSGGAVVVGSVRCVVEDEMVASGSTFDMGDNVERLKDTLNLRLCCESEKREREFAEKIERLEGAIADEVEIVYSGASASVTRATADAEGVRLEGELTIYALLSNDGSPLYLAEKSVPFDEVVEMKFEGEPSFIPVCHVVSVTATANPDESGTEVVVSAIVEMSAIGELNVKRSFDLDAFAPGSSVENTYRDYRYTELSSAFATDISGTAELKSELVSQEKLRDIPYVTGCAKVTSAEIASGEIKVCGELRLMGAASVIDGEGGVCCSGVKFNMPFEERIKCNVDANENQKLDLNVSLCRASAAVDTDSVVVSYKLSASGAVSVPSSAKLLESSNVVSKDDDKSEKVITVYYPEAGETLFDVCRKFSAPLARVAATNELSASVAGDGSSVLDGVKRLVIY